MNEMSIHWPILKELDTKFLFQIRSFMVLDYDAGLLMLTKDDQFYAYGKNLYGMLGVGHCDPICWPTRIPELCDKNLVQLKRGYFHIVALTAQGEVYAWGQNGCGQIGNGTATNGTKLLKPVLVELPTTGHDNIVATIDAGAYHCIALTSHGELFGWGENDYGQLAIGERQKQLTPIRIDSMKQYRVKQISCGHYHTMALTDRGEVFAWGSNFQGQLGNGQFDKQMQPVMINHCSNIKSIACGQSQSLLLSRAGSLYVCGSHQKDPLNRTVPSEQQFSRPFSINVGNQTTFTKICINHSLLIAMDHDDCCYVWGEFESSSSNGEYCRKPFKTPLYSIDLALSNYSLCRNTTRLINCDQTPENSAMALDTIIKLERLFNDPIASDLRFVVEDRTIFVHRWFLKASSDYYQKMLSDFWFKSSSITIYDYSYTIYYAYLRYLYLDTIDLCSFDDLCNLLSLADYHLEFELKQKCIDLLLNQISIENSCRLYELAHLYNQPSLRHKTVTFISKYSGQCLGTEAFAEMANDQQLRQQLRDDLNEEFSFECHD